MKKIIFIISIALYIFSCQGVDENPALEELVETKDSLQTVYNKLSEEIAAVEEKIKDLDTNQDLPIVTTIAIKTQKFEHYFKVQGAVQADGNALLYPEAIGRVLEINIKEGEKVQKGTVILRLDAGVLKSTWMEVDKKYELVKELYEKQKQLWEVDKVGSEIEYLNAKNQKESMEQKLKTLQKQLDMYVIKAPFSGTVDEIMPKVGELLNPALSAVRIINTSESYIKADVSESYIGKISTNTKVNLYFPSMDKEYEATIGRIGNFINPKNRTFKITIPLKKMQDILKPNLLADINIRDFVTDSAIVLPSAMIQQDRFGNEYVYILIKDNKGKNIVKKVIITTGVSYKGKTVVLKGLEGEEELIEKGARGVQDKDEVKIWKPVSR